MPKARLNAEKTTKDDAAAGRKMTLARWLTSAGSSADCPVPNRSGNNSSVNRIGNKRVKDFGSHRHRRRTRIARHARDRFP